MALLAGIGSPAGRQTINENLQWKKGDRSALEGQVGDAGDGSTRDLLVFVWRGQGSLYGRSGYLSK